MRLENILKILKEHERELREKYGLKSIGVFGSYVRGEERIDSDLDILVEFDRKIDLFEFLELEEYLSEILGVKVDLVLKRALKPRIKETILKEAIYLC